MRQLVIYCDGGFGNRFNALVSGLVIAKTCGLEPQVVWPINNWCGASLADLFEQPPPSVNRELATFVPQAQDYQFFMVEDHLKMGRPWVSPMLMTTWDAARSYLSSSDQDVFYYTALIPPFIELSAVAAQVRALRFHPRIVARMEAFLREQGLSDFLGIQIRKTDFGGNGADENNLFELISSCPQKRFFVCSDDKAVEARFSALPNVAIYPKRAHVEKLVGGGWNSTTTDQSGRLYASNVKRSGDSVEDALVDLLILSRSQIVKTSNSTFLNTALLLKQTDALFPQPAAAAPAAPAIKRSNVPLVSILVPVYNRENLVGRTLKAALAQTVADIEVIVVDNQSTDGTFDVCAGLAEYDKRIRLYRNDSNLGPVRNWMKCVEYASAPYAKILFSDDLIAPTFIERTLPALLAPDCALAYTPAIVGYEDWKGGMQYRQFQGDCKILRDAFVRLATHMEHFTPVSPGAALFRTADLRKHIFTELPGVQGYDFARYGAGVDWLIYTLTALNYGHVAYIDEPLTYFHAHAGSISINNENNLVPTGYALAKKWLCNTVKGL